MENKTSKPKPTKKQTDALTRKIERWAKELVARDYFAKKNGPISDKFLNGITLALLAVTLAACGSADATVDGLDPQRERNPASLTPGVNEAGGTGGQEAPQAQGGSSPQTGGTTQPVIGGAPGSGGQAGSAQGGTAGASYNCAPAPTRSNLLDTDSQYLNHCGMQGYFEAFNNGGSVALATHLYNGLRWGTCVEGSAAPSQSGVSGLRWNIGQDKTNPAQTTPVTLPEGTTITFITNHARLTGARVGLLTSTGDIYCQREDLSGKELGITVSSTLTTRCTLVHLGSKNFDPSQDKVIALLLLNVTDYCLAGMRITTP